MANEFKAKNGVITPTVQSTVSTGTAPFTIASTTAVTNLNADLLDGQHASDFAASGHNHDSTYVNVSGDTMTGVLEITGGSASAPGITFSGDTNTGIYRPAADSVAVAVGGSEKVRVNGSGLGVNTGASFPIEVSANDNDGIVARFTRGFGGYTNARMEFSTVESSGDAILDFTGSHTPVFYLKTGGSTRMTINTTGQLGINTSPNTTAGMNLEGVGSWTTSGWYKSLRLPQTRAIQFTGSTKHYGFGASSDEFYIFSTTAEDGSASANYLARFYTSGQFGVAAQYNNTTASAANAVVDSLGVIYRSTSSIKYKTQVEDLDPLYAEKILDFRPVWYRSTCEKDRNDWSWYGFIAEELAEIEPRFVEYKQNEDGTLEPEGVQYSRMVVPLIALVQKQQQQINDLLARVAALEGAA